MAASSSAARAALDVLGDANRRDIVRLLGDRDRSVQELADALPISRPAVSRHLRLLKEAGLVADRSEGTRNIFHLNQESLADIQTQLAELWGNAALRFQILAENTEDVNHD
jgi:DNA-binding transcriptional ArsR family regulator